MALCEIHMENFSVFSDGKISLSPNINVFIGANGTGKTQLFTGIISYGAQVQ
ncbi:AAA family ATPase [Megasphaera sp.]|jgi:recombinational DNA repair ATPase RecF|uniref:AAA family ATPase n=1 Tax=Megasphaera sp. TaxID=2023260 RepID=UPI00351FD419